MNQQIQQNIAPSPYQTFQPSQFVINPLDGRQYQVKQQNQGQGVSLVDPQTQQELMVSEEDSQNLKPALKTSMVETYIDRLINKSGGVWAGPITREKAEFLVDYLDRLEERVDTDKVKEDLYNVVGDDKFFDSLDSRESIGKEELSELVREKVKEWLGKRKEWKEEWEEEAVRILTKFVGRSKESKISLLSIANEIVSELMGEKLPEVNVLSSLNIKRGIKMNNWHETRKKLRTHSQMSQEEIQSLPTYKESVEERMKRESKYTPYEGELDEGVGRDKKTGLPMRGGGGEYEIGMTEFPKDVDKEKDPEGYGKMTMEEMDRKFEEERPHFKNEQYLPDNTKKREESDTYLSGEEKNKKIKDLRKNFPEPRYSSQEELLDSMIGKTASDELDENDIRDTAVAIIESDLSLVEKVKELQNLIKEYPQYKGIITPYLSSKTAGDEEVTKLPIQYKDVKKAPGKEMGYKEPEVLEKVSPDVRTAIELFKSTQSEIDSIQAQIQEKTKPLQQAILDATKGLQSDMAEKAALLKTCLDMIYEELEKTNDRVGVMGEEIYAAVSREKATAPSASLPQILKKAEQVHPQLVEEINKVKAMVESENTKLVIEQFLYKYPVSEVQKKKLSSLENVDVFIEEVVSLIESLQQLNEIL